MTRHILFASLTALLLAVSCAHRGYETFTGYAQGGTYQVKANLEGVSIPHNTIAAAIDSLLEGIDFSISGYNRSSILSRRNAGEDISPDRYFSELMELSEKYKELSGGAFDVCSGPLSIYGDSDSPRTVFRPTMRYRRPCRTAATGNS